MLELCRVTTADGLQLDGAYQQPDRSAANRDCALLLIHGTGSNFYGSGILDKLSEQAVQDGYSVLRINTRGHDLTATIPGLNGPVRGGAAYERVSDAQFDLTAWADWLSQRGHPRIALLGHSLGGVKAIWSQALAPHPKVCGVIGLSPPRFSHQRFQNDSRCGAFRRDYALAEQLVAEGRAETLLTVAQPLPMVITAAGYLEKYGPDDPLNYLPILKQVACPQLIILGEQSVETNPAFDGLPSELETLAASQHRLSFQLIPGADINYRNAPTEPWRRIIAWLDSRVGA